ncbi:Enoyl-CoA hydratase/carnithine racemase [Micromonospora pallida]|uniref:Enoyl-CoA hydratase/carnithine racemase n=1 Tax=Micromonospora pallida TaxID=145854 RepID=A0A1C6S0D1_9ACTN|nr:enoyl-CoA hydratase/isomerase family protein [Micromonospora pallida]SCL22865.1 Enoyl-CoA hydratase/carnithine racemase [Micromonospora pallida]
MTADEATVLHRQDLDGGVVVLEMARPHRLNAISRQLATALVDALDGLATEQAARVVVLAGAGDRAFGAGIDIRELAAQTPPERDVQQRTMVRLQRTLSDYPRPTVAVVHGIAAGASLQLALHCDLLLVGPEARLGMPELGAGLPGLLGGWLLHTRGGPQLAADLLLGGRWLSGPEAVAAGLAARLVPLGEERATAVDVARQIAGYQPDALAATHAWLRRLRIGGAAPSFAEAIDAAGEVLHAANRRHPGERPR